jgi:pimeloyl-ACP methyl ester carboxylesterase
MGRIQVPTLVICGAGDVLTPVADLRSAYDSLASKEKHLVIASRKYGYAHDYGHVDLVLGIDARREIYPHVADWIEGHA